MRLEINGQTNVGMKRDHNEDNFLLVPEENFVAVADGMGGHASGEVASGIAVEEMKEFLVRSGRDAEATWPFKLDRARNLHENRVIAAIKLANQRIREHSQTDAKMRGMGTTVISALFTPEGTFVGWAGDSRCYRYRGGKLDQVSRDHSLLEDFKRARNPTPEEIAAFPHKNVILRALGMTDQLEVEVVVDAPADGDIYLLCSDGLSGMIDDDRIASIMAKTPDLEKCVGQLIDAANAAGGADNVTVILVRWLNA